MAPRAAAKREQVAMASSETRPMWDPELYAAQQAAAAGAAERPTSAGDGPSLEENGEPKEEEPSEGRKLMDDIIAHLQRPNTEEQNEASRKKHAEEVGFDAFDLAAFQAAPSNEEKAELIKTFSRGNENTMRLCMMALTRHAVIDTAQILQFMSYLELSGAPEPVEQPPKPVWKDQRRPRRFDAK